MKKLFYLLAAATMMVALASCGKIPTSNAVDGQWVMTYATFYDNEICDGIAIEDAQLAQVNLLNAISIEGKKVYNGPVAAEYTVQGKNMVFTNLPPYQTERTMVLSDGALEETIRYSSKQTIKVNGKTITYDEASFSYKKIAPFSFDGKTFDYERGEFWYDGKYLGSIPKSYSVSNYLQSWTFENNYVNVNGQGKFAYTLQDGLMMVKMFSSDTYDVYAYYDTNFYEFVVYYRFTSDLYITVDGSPEKANHLTLIYREHQDKSFGLDEVDGTWISGKATYYKNGLVKESLTWRELFQKNCVDGFTIADYTLTRIGESAVPFEYSGTALYLSDKSFKTWKLNVDEKGHIIETITRDDYTFKPYDQQVTFDEVRTIYYRASPLSRLLDNTYKWKETEYYLDRNPVGVKQYDEKLVISSSNMTIDGFWVLNYIDRGPFIVADMSNSARYYVLSLDGGISIAAYFVSDSPIDVSINGKTVKYNVSIAYASISE